VLSKLVEGKLNDDSRDQAAAPLQSYFCRDTNAMVPTRDRAVTRMADPVDSAPPD
jgi:hypothetical protein